MIPVILLQIVSIFNGNASLIQPINRLSVLEDLLVGVSCVCEAINDTMTALFHDTEYRVEQHDTPGTLNAKKFSGLAMNVGDGKSLSVNDNITIHMPCGCSTTASHGVLSYAVQEGDTLRNIESLFRSNARYILNLNPSLINADFIKPGWILFVPMGVAGSSKKSKSLLNSNLSMFIFKFLETT